MTDSASVAPHQARQSHSYVIAYPPHPARESDPHYRDFHAFHKKYGPDARCAFAIHATLVDDAAPVRQSAPPHRLIGAGELRAECDILHPIELHHSRVEFALQNAIDLAIFEKDYPGISDPNTIGAWVESGANFIWYCEWHHRGRGGAHNAAAADFEAEKYIANLILKQ